MSWGERLNGCSVFPLTLGERVGIPNKLIKMEHPFLPVSFV
ncbi:MAG: hypothetical protein OEZ22_09500 [Spirochaetia bacterium]|nr:hypothetical protein [Spirochaetia bacterium]